MPNYTSSLNITTGRGDKLSASKTGTYQEIFNVRQKVDNSDAFISLLTGAATKGAITVDNFNSLIIKNSGVVGAEIQVSNYVHANATPDTTGALNYSYHVLGAGDFMYLANIRQMTSANDNATANGSVTDNAIPTPAMYEALNNVAKGDPQLLNEAVDGTETPIDVDEGAYFFVGDLIRLENEICEVVSISSNTITVIRGTHGSTKATHAEDVAIRLPFFNAYGGLAYNRYSVSQTDSSGNFMAKNFFGFGRNTDGSGNRESMGIVAGSFSCKFYESGYQNMTNDGGITSSTSTGLTAETTFYLSVAQNGGSTDAVTFTTGTNVNFGGTDGVISKLQTMVDDLFIDPAKNGYEDGCTFAIVNGNLRCTSNSHLSTSAIAITTNTAGTAGTDELFDTSNVIGRFPATIPAAVASALPPDTILDKVTGAEIQNISKMAYDDGFSNIKGMCSGNINYETGAITLLNAPPNSEFVFSANYGASQSGGNKFGANDANSIVNIGARSTNSKIDTTIELIGLK